MIEKVGHCLFHYYGTSGDQSLLNAINDIYQTFEISKIKPIKGYIQVVNIIIITVGVILVIANLIGKSPTYSFKWDWCSLSRSDVGF